MPWGLLVLGVASWQGASRQDSGRFNAGCLFSLSFGDLSSLDIAGGWRVNDSTHEHFENSQQRYTVSNLLLFLGLPSLFPVPFVFQSSSNST